MDCPNISESPIHSRASTYTQYIHQHNNVIVLPNRGRTWTTIDSYHLVEDEQDNWQSLYLQFWPKESKLPLQDLIMWSWTWHTWAERNGKRDNDSRERVILSSEVKHHGSASAVCSHECHPWSAHNLHCTKNGKCRTNSMSHFNFSSHNQNMLQSISLKLNTKQISVMHWVTQFTETRWKRIWHTGLKTVHADEQNPCSLALLHCLAHQLSPESQLLCAFFSFEIPSAWEVPVMFSKQLQVHKGNTS